MHYMKKDSAVAGQTQNANKAGTSTIASMSSPNLPGFIQIKNLVSQLNSKKMLRQQRSDIINIVQQLGQEGNIYLLECLLESIDLNNLAQQARSTLHSTVKGQFISQHLHELVFSTTAATNFIDFFPQVLLRVLATSISANTKAPSIYAYVLDLFKYLKIPIIDQIFLALSLALTHQNDALSCEGLRMLKERINDYSQQTTPQEMPTNGLPLILLQFVNQNLDFKNMTHEIASIKQQILLIDPKNRPILLGRNSADDDGHGLVGTDELLDPELHREIVFPKLDSISNFVSPADIMRDLGPSLTSSVEGLVSDLQIFDGQWTALHIYRCIEVMASGYENGGGVSTSDEVAAHSKLSHSFYQAEQRNNQQLWNNFTNQDQQSNNNGTTTSTPVAPIHTLQWNFDVFLEYITKHVLQQNPTIRWSDVILSIDSDESSVMNHPGSLKQFLGFMICVNRSSPFTMPQELLLKPWKHARKQITFLKNLILLGQPELVRFSEVKKTKLNLEFDDTYIFESLNPPYAQFFGCLETLQLLVELSEGDAYLTVLNIFQQAINEFPDLLTVALAQIHPAKGSNLLDEVFSAVLPNYFTHHITSITILETIWRFNEGLFISGACEIYRRQKAISIAAGHAHLQRIIEISQYIKDLLSVLVNCHDYTFAVAIAVLAGKKEYLHFDLWVNERIATIGDPFVNSLLNYIDETIVLPLREASQTIKNTTPLPQRVIIYETILDKAQTTIEILTVIFESLLVEQLPEKLTNKNRAKLQEQYRDVLQMLQVLGNACTNTVHGINNPTNGNTEPICTNTEAERKSNTYFEKFYAKETTLEEMTALLKTLNASNSAEDKKVFTLMVSSLLEESKFHEQYPAAELLLTGSLFGIIIANSLINSKPLGLMMEAILDSTKRSQKRVDFAAKAIEAMRPRLIEFPYFTAACFDPACLLAETHPSLLISIHSLLNEKKVNINIAPKQIEQIKQRADLLKQQEQNQQQQQQQRTKAAVTTATSQPEKKPSQNIQQTTPTPIKAIQQQVQQNQAVPHVPSFTVSQSPTPAAIVTPQPSSIPNSTSQQQQQPIVSQQAKNTEEKVQLPMNAISTQVNEDKQTPTSNDNNYINTTSTINNNGTKKLQLKKNLKSNKSVFVPGETTEQIQTQLSFIPTPTATPPPLLISQNSAPVSNQSLLSFKDASSFIMPSRSDDVGLFTNPIGSTIPSSNVTGITTVTTSDAVDYEIRVRPYAGGIGFIQLCPPPFDPQVYSRLTLSAIIHSEDCISIEDHIKNKIIFGQNNLTESSLEKHVNDIKSFSDNENFLNWFARYLVIRRATLDNESSVHVYLALIQRVNKPALHARVIKDSLILLAKLLASEMPVSPSDRSTIKAVAYWIGMFTLARNHSISAKYLNIKAMIVNAYPHKLDIVIPVVFHILRSSKESVFFNPKTNRWVRRILALLEELKSITQKETVRLQINQIFAALQVDPTLLEPCTYLQYHLAEASKVQSIFANPAYMNHSGFPGQMQQSQHLPPGQVTNPFYTVGSSASRTSNDRPFDGFDVTKNGQAAHFPPIFVPLDRIVIDKELEPIIPANIDLKQIVFTALNQTIADIIQPVMARSVTVALIAARELTLKDYCTDPDEKNLIKGVQSLVQKLAGPLAITTSRDFLRQNLQQAIKIILESEAKDISAQDKEAILQKTINDNQDFGYEEIRTRAIEKAMYDVTIDEQIQQAVEARRAAREANILYKDDKYYQYLQTLPLALQQRTPKITQSNAKTPAATSSISSTH